MATATPSSPKRRRLSREPPSAAVSANSSAPTAKLPLSTRRNGASSPKKPPALPSSSPMRKRRQPVLRTPPPSPNSAMLARRIHELEASTADLAAAVKAEQARVKQLSAPAPDGPIDSLISSLLSANDATLPPPPARAPVFDFSLALADPGIPSLLPLPSPTASPSSFSTLRFTSITTTASPTTPSQTSTSVAGHTLEKSLFFRLAFKVHTDRLEVLSTACSVSAWARPELAPLLHVAQRDRDPGTLLYALDSYARLAATRAAAWAEIAGTYSARGLCLAATSPRGFLGCAVFVLKARAGGIELVVRWAIEVDDVGEAGSRVRGDVRVSKTWGSGVGRGVGRLFDGLVETRGVVKAVEVVVGLLWPGEEEEV